MKKPKIVSIVGLTASGKSSLGIRMAEKFNGEIVSCDSRQVFTGLDVGSAKVTKEEQTQVKHYMLDVVEPKEHYNVADFQREAYKCIEDILSRGKLPILVGGSGLYSRSIVEGYGFDGKNSPRYNVLQICLMPSKEFIRELIIKRIDQRLSEGLIEETRELLKRGVSAEFLQSLGLEYYWNVEYIEGRVTLEEYKKNLATKTAQFAKRQRTWFKKERCTVYLADPAEFVAEAERLIREFTEA